MTLIFGNFPHPPDMSGGVENSQTSIFLHRLVCGSPGLKKFLVRSIKNQKPCVLVFGCFCFFVVVFVVFFCMIWFYIIIFSPPEHRKHHLNLKWGDLIFWFRNLSCTHFATFQHRVWHMMRWHLIQNAEIKKSNHPILDSSDVFCVQGD